MPDTSASITPDTETVFIAEVPELENYVTLAYLKIKIKSLAAESQIIRVSENLYKKGKAYPDNRATWLGLKSHRINEVRSEARASLLAYGYVRGRSYLSMESKCYTKPDWAVVARIIKKYGPDKEDPRQFDEAKFKAWQVAKSNIVPIAA